MKKNPLEFIGISAVALIGIALFTAADTASKNVTVGANNVLLSPSASVFYASNQPPISSITNALNTWTGSTNLSNTAVGVLGSAATNSTGDFATSVQGGKADTALQAGTSITNISGLQIALDSKAATNDSRFPTTDEKAAFVGSYGTPAGTNVFVTALDPANTNSRPPAGSAGGRLSGTYPNPSVATNGVTAGTYGSTNTVSVITVDSSGFVTSVGNATITPDAIGAASAATSVPSTRTISTTAPMTGGGDFSANRTFGISTATTNAVGVSQLATDTEIQTGTDTAKVVRVSGLSAWWTWIKTQAATIAGAWTFSGPLTASGNLTVNGNTTLGDASGDSLTINAGTISAPNASGTSSDSLAKVGTLDTRYGPASVTASVPAELSLRDYFVSGTNTSGQIGSLGWTLFGTGAGAAYIGGSGGSFGLTPPAITSSLATASLSFPNTSYTGADFASTSTTRQPEMIASIGSGAFGMRNRSLSFSFLATGGTFPTLQSTTAPNAYGIRYIPPATTWTANTTYSIGANAKPVTPNSLKYICTTNGTSSGSEPTWPTTIGTTVADGTVTWTCAGMDGNASHLFEFFVTGADPIVNITTANSTVAMSSSANQFYALKMRRSGSAVYFSVNGEAEVSLSTNATYTGRPAFSVRNDTNASASNVFQPIDYFGFYIPVRR